MARCLFAMVANGPRREKNLPPLIHCGYRDPANADLTPSVRGVECRRVGPEIGVARPPIGPVSGSFGGWIVRGCNNAECAIPRRIQIK